MQIRDWNADLLTPQSKAEVRHRPCPARTLVSWRRLTALCTYQHRPRAEGCSGCDSVVLLLTNEDKAETPSRKVDNGLKQMVCRSRAGQEDAAVPGRRPLVSVNYKAQPVSTCWATAGEVLTWNVGSPPTSQSSH